MHHRCLTKHDRSSMLSSIRMGLSHLSYCILSRCGGRSMCHNRRQRLTPLRGPTATPGSSSNHASASSQRHGLGGSGVEQQGSGWADGGDPRVGGGAHSSVEESVRRWRSPLACGGASSTLPMPGTGKELAHRCLVGGDWL
jgi:hypothetical protein